MLAVGGELALPPSVGAGHGQHGYRAFREAGRLVAELRDGCGYRLLFTTATEALLSG